MRELFVHPSLTHAARALEEELASSESRVLVGPKHIAYSDWLGFLARALGLSAPASAAHMRLLLEDLIGGDEEAAAQKGLGVAPLWELFAALDLTTLYGGRQDRALRNDWPLRGEKGFLLARLFTRFNGERARADLLTEGDIWRAFLTTDPAQPLSAAFSALRVVTFIEPPELLPLRLNGLARLKDRLEVRARFSLAHDLPDYFAPQALRLSALERESPLEAEALSFVEPALAGDETRMAALRQGAPDERLTLLRPIDRTQEGRVLGEELLRLLKEGVAPSELAVVVPDLDAMRPHLRELLKELRLPLSYSRPQPLLAAPSLVWISALREALGEGLDRARLLVLARAALPFGIGPRNGADPRLEEAERFWRENEIDEPPSHAASAARLSSDEALEERVRRAASSWVDFVGMWRAPRPLSAWLKLLEETLLALEVPAPAAADDARHFAYAVQAKRTLLRLIGEWRRGVVPEKTRVLTATAFFEWLMRHGRVDLMRRANSEPSQIAVLRPGEAAFGTYRHLFLLDAVEPAYPAIGAATNLLHDEESRLLQGAVRTSLFPSRRELYRRERETFARLLLAADKVTIFAPRLIEQTEVALSPFVQERLTAFFLREIEGGHRPHPRHAYERAYTRLARRKGALATRVPARFAATLNRRVGKANAIAERLNKFGRSPYDARLPEDWLERLAPASLLPLRFGYSWFDNQALCPFRTLGAQVLRLKEPARPTRELSPLLVGSALHAVLERVYAHDKWSRGEESDDLQRFAEAELTRAFLDATRAWPRYRRAALPARARVWAVRVRRLAKNFAGELLSASPRFFELAFGSGRGDTPVPTLAVPLAKGGELALTGRIDRVDAGFGTLSLIDYKTSRQLTPYNAKLKPERFAERDFQLAIYLLALLELAKTDPRFATVKSLKAAYVLVGEPTLWTKPKVVDLDNHESRELFACELPLRANLATMKRPNLANRLESLYDDIRGGRFSPAPLECKDCPFPDLCRYERVCGEDADWMEEE